MKILVKLSNIDQKRELSITDGTVTIKTKCSLMMKEEDLHNWITRVFNIWLKLKENQN